MCSNSLEKNFLSGGSNKDRLAKYYSGFCKKTNISVLKDEVLYIKEERVVKVSVDNVAVVGELKPNHEEVDTRMLAHTSYALENGATFVLCV